MFTVKLCNYDEETKSTNTLSLSCKAYHLYDTKTQCSVIVYNELTLTNGVEYHIGDGKDDSYKSCFVENMAGKTIARHIFEASL